MSDRENGDNSSGDGSPVVPKRRSYKQSRSRSQSRRKLSRSRSRSRGRKAYYSRSRSRSPQHKRYRSSRYSRSRSRSFSPYNRRHSSDHYRSRFRSRSKSPLSSRRRHLSSRENPKTSHCVGVFGLSLYTKERDLREAFSRYGSLEEVNVVYDHQTGRSRGFAFLYYRNLDDAVEAKERAAGTEIDGRKIRVDFSITERAHTPTPGIYLGKGTSSASYHSSRRSPSPYHHRGYSRSRSRSRSYSPRKYSSRY